MDAECLNHFTVYFIYLGRQGRGGGVLHSLVHSPVRATAQGQAKARSKQLHSGLPRGWGDPTTELLLSSTVLAGSWDGGQSQNLNPGMGYAYPSAQLDNS